MLEDFGSLGEYMIIFDEKNLEVYQKILKNCEVALKFHNCKFYFVNLINFKTLKFCMSTDAKNCNLGNFPTFIYKNSVKL